jgi:hypothetical protein
MKTYIITHLFWNLGETTDNRNKNGCNLHFDASSRIVRRREFESVIYW